jgi:hypothetical protein
VHLKDLRIKTLLIDEPVDEYIQMKQLLHMYIGLIPVGEAGKYMVKLVAACPKVSTSNLTEQLTNLALLNVWCGGLSDGQSLALASRIREKRDLVSLHLQNSPSTRLLASSISRVFTDRALYLRLVVWNRSGEDMVNISHYYSHSLYH